MKSSRIAPWRAEGSRAEGSGAPQRDGMSGIRQRGRTSPWMMWTAAGAIAVGAPRGTTPTGAPTTAPSATGPFAIVAVQELREHNDLFMSEPKGASKREEWTSNRPAWTHGVGDAPAGDCVPESQAREVLRTFAASLPTPPPPPTPTARLADKGKNKDKGTGRGHRPPSAIPLRPVPMELAVRSRVAPPMSLWGWSRLPPTTLGA
eukprot:9488297-Pyramimonas_sp.AAC.1